MNARRLVGTVLRPHHREDAQFDEVWFATEQFLDSLKFFLGEIVGGDDFGSDHLV